MLDIKDLQRKTDEVVSVAGSLARALSSFPENGDNSPQEKIALLNSMFAQVCEIRATINQMDDPIVGMRIETERILSAEKAALR